jgi:hypothetical protein
MFIDQQRGWRSLFLRCYALDTAVASHFPKTMAAYGAAGTDVTTIFFSVLDPGTTLSPHHGPYKGILRYHLCAHLGQSIVSLCCCWTDQLTIACHVFALAVA